MICEQQKPAAGLDTLNPLSPPLTPGHKSKNFPNNFLTSSQDNICSTTVVNSRTNTTTQDTIPTAHTVPCITPIDAVDSPFNFNIPCFISTDLKPSHSTRETKDSQYSHVSLNLQELHSSTSHNLTHTYPSPVPSPEESKQSIQAFLETPAALHSPAFASSNQHPSREEQSPFHLHQRHPNSNQHHHLNHAHTFPTDTVQKRSQELPSFSNFMRPKEKELVLDIPASDANNTTLHQFSFNIPNSNSNNRSSNVTKSDVKDIFTNQINTTHYPYHKAIGSQQLSFDMSQNDVTTDINNNNSSSSNHDFHSAATTKNDYNNHDCTQEINSGNVSLPWAYLMSACGEPASNVSVNDQNDFFPRMDDQSQFSWLFPDICAIVSDVHMADSSSNAEYDIMDGSDICELDHFPDFLDRATSCTSEFLPITEVYSPNSTDSTSSDEFSEGDCKDNQYLQVLDVNSSFANLINSHEDSDHPQSPSNSDEGFVDCAPSFERDMSLVGKTLPFDGKFPETEDSEVSSMTADSRKRPRKHQSALKLKKRKIGACPPGERRKPGRKPGQVSNVLHLWEFMRDLLHDPKFNGCIIEWISQIDGVFRVLDSAAVARLWGEKKNNKKAMTYEKLSRSLRYSRLEGYFANLPKDKNYPKKLCFKFGPKSKNWSLTL